MMLLTPRVQGFSDTCGITRGGVQYATISRGVLHKREAPFVLLWAVLVCEQSFSDELKDDESYRFGPIHLERTTCRK